MFVVVCVGGHWKKKHVVMGVSSSSWGYSHSWIWFVSMGKSHGKSQTKMDDDWGYPHDLGHFHRHLFKAWWPGLWMKKRLRRMLSSVFFFFWRFVAEILGLFRIARCKASGKHTKNYGQISSWMGKSTINHHIFSSKTVKSAETNLDWTTWTDQHSRHQFHGMDPSCLWGHFIPFFLNTSQKNLLKDPLYIR